MLNEYLNAIRQFCELQARRGRTGQFVRYQILSDEVNDPTLVSFRVYGTRDEANVVMVAAGTNGIWEQPLSLKFAAQPMLLVLLALHGGALLVTAHCLSN